MLGLLTNKWSLVILAIIISYGLGWKTNGWRMEAAQKSALESAIKKHQKQAEKDAEIARAIIKNREKDLEKTRRLLDEARKTKFSCKFNTPSFTRLYNESAGD